MKKLLLLTLVLVAGCFIFAGFALAEAPIVGKWKTIDDETNEPKSIVQIFEKDGQYYGKIIELFLKPDADQNPTCDKCADDDPRKDQPTLGMEIIQDLKPDGDVYSGGTILDPKKGKVYKCKIWAEGDELKVQGSFLFISRTQTWHRVE
ncbi:MAG: DUF2147 domain-containing protein [Desulfotignum sp.]|nr:DUF2147 domain-containing protein [Desulfotignum sp.]MCF8136327.1 DUF2147 domain-containing protein [Desulfotignum sp.]